MKDFVSLLDKLGVSYTIDKGDSITVGGYLYLRGTAITQLPDNLKCDSLYLDVEKVGNIAFRKNCGTSGRTIFCAWLNGEFVIAAGCFLGSINRFCDAVDNKYSGSSAEKYKSDAMVCMHELAVLLNKEAA